MRARRLAWGALGVAGAVAGAAALQGCATRLPAGIEPVHHFALDRYLGTWYEIARLDHSFERGLEQTTATYSLQPDGSVQVVNRGFDPRAGRWKQATGKARFVQGPDVAHLKVSFFGPFYGAYGVFVLDPQYRYALVSGADRSYLWVLSRTPTLPAGELDLLLLQARAAGFDTDRLVYPRQQAAQP